MRLIRGLGLVMGAVLLSSMLAVPAASATATASSAATDALAAYDCVIVAERISPAKPDLRLGPRLCGQSPERSRAAADASYVLVVFFEHVKYNTVRRGRSTAVTVGSPCDSVGYRMSDLRDANNDVGGISSYRYGTAGCNGGQIFYNTNLTGSQAIISNDCPNVGVVYNDHVWSMRAWRYPDCTC